MKTSLWCFSFLTASLVGLRAADQPAVPAAEDGQPVASHITDVVVFADRAQVTRVATADLTAEPGRFAFTKLPGWIDEGSVRVSCAPADAGQILDVQVRRTFLARTTDEDFQKAEAAVREVADQIAALDDEKGVLDAETKQVDAIRAFSADKLPKDATSREVKPDEYAQSVKFVTGSLREIAAARRELEKKRRDLQPELNARQRTLNELRQRAQLEQRAIVVTAKGAGKTATLTLSYLLPGATWKPVHELRTAPGGKSVSLASFAVVMQTTGEDWTDVALSLSTQKSTETMKIPELEALLVGGARMPRFVTRATDSFKEAEGNWFANNGSFNIIMNRDVAAQRQFTANNSVLIDNVKHVEQVFAALQQRGTTAHFAALGRQTVRTDGGQARVPIGSADLPAQHRNLAAPELSLNAARIVDLTNSTGQPLLPGAVSLFLAGSFLGQTETEFVAPGEDFPLYLGVADQVKLSRTLDKKRSALTRGGTKTRMQVSFLVTAQNLDDEPVALQLTDRVPVSETDEVRVSGVKIQPDGKPDAKGLLRWDLNFGPKQTREYRIEYVIEYPAGLPAAEAAKPGGPPGRLDPLRDQIRSLEKLF